MTLYNAITNKNIEVELVTVQHTFGDRTVNFCHYELDGQILYRIETKGRTGKSLYANSGYVNSDGKMTSVTGSQGGTGKGWGGRVVGFLTKSQIDAYPVKIN